MKGIDFKEANANAGLVFTTDHIKEPLRVYTDGLACVSVWKLNDEDIKKILQTREIQLLVCTTPVNHPPVALSVENILPDIGTILNSLI